ncbi:MAG: serine--tRNA ligase, partial [Clostridiales bacterium]|nr:serine--tRNA ligase [Clostridiales bacterium]
MLDIKRIRQNPDELKEALRLRNNHDTNVDTLLEADTKRRELMQSAEELKAYRNEVSAMIPKMKKSGENTDELMEKMKSTSTQIKELDEELAMLEAFID